MDHLNIKDDIAVLHAVIYMTVQNSQTRRIWKHSKCQNINRLL